MDINYLVSRKAPGTHRVNNGTSIEHYRNLQQIWCLLKRNNNLCLVTEYESPDQNM